MSDRAGVVTTALVASIVFAVVALAVAGALDLLLVPDPIGLSTGTDLDEYRRLHGFSGVIAGFVGSLAAGVAAQLAARRAGLEDRLRLPAILAAPLLLGALWLVSLRPGLAIFAGALVLYLCGAALAAMLAALRGEPQTDPRGGRARWI